MLQLKLNYGSNNWSNETAAKTHLGGKIAQKSDLEIPKRLEIIFRVG